MTPEASGLQMELPRTRADSVDGHLRWPGVVRKAGCVLSPSFFHFEETKLGGEAEPTLVRQRMGVRMG